MKLTRRGLLGSVALGLLSFITSTASAFWQSRDSNYDVAIGGAPPAPSLTLVSSTTANATSLTVPAHLPGDLIIICADRLSTTPPSLPANFVNILTKASTATNPVSKRVGWRYATGTDDTADPSGTWTNAAQLYCEIWRSSTGYVAAIGTSASATSTTNTVNYPALTLIDGSGLSQVIGLAAVANTVETIATAPSGMTNRTSLAGTGITVAGHDTNGAVSSWASTNVVTTGTAGKSVSCTIEIMLLSAGTVSNVYQHVGGGQLGFANSEQGKTFFCPLPEASGAGNTIVLDVTWPNGTTITVSDNNGNTWGAATVHANAGGGNQDSAMYVLPNCNAGFTTIEFAFSALVNSFTYSITEYYHVATSSPVNGSTSAAAVTGPKIPAVSFTPTNNNANGGNIIRSYMAKATEVGSTIPGAIWPTTPMVLLDANIGTPSAAYDLGHAAATYIQAASAAFVPTFSALGDTDQYNICAVALKIDTSAGTPPSAGMRVNRVSHFTAHIFPSATTGNYRLQLATSGNLRLITSSQNQFFTAQRVFDNEGNEWSNDGTSPPFCWFLANAQPNPNLIVTIVGGSSYPGVSHRFFDVSGAATSPFDSAVNTGAGQALVSVSSFTDVNHPSPTSSAGITFSAVGLGQGPGYSVTAPVGAVWDLCTYPPDQTDISELENSDINAHYKYSASGSQTWSYTIASNASNSTEGGGYISFKS